MIKVKLNDGYAEVGGDFGAALEFVKGWQGRSYDSAAKTWTVPTSLAEFLRRCHLPVDYSGPVKASRPAEVGHQTRYGNRWNAQDWQAAKAGWRASAEAAAAHQDEVERAERELREGTLEVLLSAFGDKAETIHNLIFRRYYGDWRLALDDGMIRFSSPDKEALFLQAMARHDELLGLSLAAYERQREAAQAAEETAWEAYGIE